ncbi:hypothetical protein MASR2M47_41570 [Draconibacterium sp.]
MTLFVAVFIISCSEQTEDIIPEFNIANSTIDVGYEEGQSVVDITSNVIYYVDVDDAAKGWLKYSFTDFCKTLWISYSENTDTTASRTGYITISKNGVTEVMTVIQAKATPPRIKPVLNIPFQASDNKLIISAQECENIPLGSFVVIESSSETGSFKLSGFDEVSGNQSEGKFSFVWTHEMDSISDIEGLTGILGNGFNPTKVYASYAKRNFSWVEAGSVSFGGVTYNFINIPAEETPKIPLGSTMNIGCPKDIGVFIIGFSTRLIPKDKKVFFPWKKEYINNTGNAEFIRSGGFEVSEIYSISFNIDLFPEIVENGNTNILTLGLKEASYIPIGASVVIKCENDQGTISINGFDNLTGNPVAGEFSFTWTSAMRNAGELKATIVGGSKPMAMYFRN